MQLSEDTVVRNISSASFEENITISTKSLETNLGKSGKKKKRKENSLC